jgi:hypothetical protein
LSLQTFFHWVNRVYIIHDQQSFSLDFLEPSFTFFRHVGQNRILSSF